MHAHYLSLSVLRIVRSHYSSFMYIGYICIKNMILNDSSLPFSYPCTTTTFHVAIGKHACTLYVYYWWLCLHTHSMPIFGILFPLKHNGSLWSEVPMVFKITSSGCSCTKISVHVAIRLVSMLNMTFSPRGAISATVSQWKCLSGTFGM